MTFMHKLSRRLAMLKDAWLVVALAALGCEKPVAVALTDRPILVMDQVFNARVLRLLSSCRDSLSLRSMSRGGTARAFRLVCPTPGLTGNGVDISV